MAGNYETDYDSYQDYLPSYDTSFDLPLALRFTAGLRLFLLVPAALITNLILSIMILSNKKIRGDPWRWLIVTASISMIVTLIFNIYSTIVTLFNVPPLCHGPWMIFFIVWPMATIMIVLVVTERFRAIQLGNEKVGGFGKKAVILCLVLFWIAVILFTLIGQVIVPLITHGSGIFNGCNLPYGQIISILVLVLLCWSFPTFLVATIGSCVYKNRKSTSDAMKKYIMAPLLVISIFSLIGEVLPMISIVVGFFGTHIFYCFSDLNYFVFALTWLITWTRNGDITGPRCCGGSDEENQHLLENK